MGRDVGTALTRIKIGTQRVHVWDTAYNGHEPMTIVWHTTGIPLKNYIWKSKFNVYYRFWFVLTHILGSVASAISSGSPGHLSAESHTSEDLLLGSLQSTLDPSKSSWEPSSLSTSQQGRTSSKNYLVKSSSPLLEGFDAVRKIITSGRKSYLLFRLTFSYLTCIGSTNYVTVH